MDRLGPRYVAALDEIDEHVRAIGPDRWSNATPCTDWDVRALVDHIVYETLWVPDLLGGKTLGEVGDRYEGDRLGTDPVGAWTSAADAARGAVHRDETLSGTVHTSAGEVPAEGYMTEMLLDAVIHGWDVAQGIGVAHRIDPATAADLLTWFSPLAARMREAGSIAAPTPVAEDADEATRLIALSGRTP
jgi:uncharacterized protein (TIGR03086 family)